MGGSFGTKTYDAFNQKPKVLQYARTFPLYTDVRAFMLADGLQLKGFGRLKGERCLLRAAPQASSATQSSTTAAPKKPKPIRLRKRNRKRPKSTAQRVGPWRCHAVGCSIADNSWRRRV